MKDTVIGIYVIHYKFELLSIDGFICQLQKLIAVFDEKYVIKKDGG